MILVTGANGMLGQAVVAQLLAQGMPVRGFDLAPSPNPNIQSIAADIRDPEAVRQACVDVEAVIHTASLVDLHLGKPSRLYDINVTGVENLLAACLAQQVSKLVYMSSAEVISGAAPLRNADEQTPYPTPHLTYYGETKELGERLVLAANSERLATCAFRTYGIFGEGDRNFVARARAKAQGKQMPRLGPKDALTDAVYVGNVAHGLLLGLAQLEIGNGVSGQLFHITDHEPQSVQQLLMEILAPLGYRHSNVVIPMSVAWGLATLLELPYHLTKGERFANPLLTRHQLLLSSQDYYLDSRKVKTVLGYVPKFRRQEAVERTQRWLLNEFG